MNNATQIALSQVQWQQDQFYDGLVGAYVNDLQIRVDPFSRMVILESAHNMGVYLQSTYIRELFLADIHTNILLQEQGLELAEELIRVADEIKQHYMTQVLTSTAKKRPTPTSP